MQKLIIISILCLIMFVGCSTQKKIKRASSKIYNLTERFPSLIELKDTTLFFNDTIITAYSVVDTSFHDSILVQLQDSLVIRDSLNVLTIYRKDVSLLGFKSECLADTQFVLKNIGFKFPNIVAHCNCKTEVKKATKDLRRQRRRLIFIIICFAAFAGYFAGRKLMPW